jgi:hypothetical protein
MSEKSRARVFGYLAAAGAGLVGAYVLAIRPWHQRWGATRAELATAMAGDDLIAAANWMVTRAVSIRATPSMVWPWLVQMGYQRGGLYSYDWLDRLAGVLDRPSADVILPEFQNMAIGEVIPLPNDPGWPVADLKKEKFLVLDVVRPRLHITWSFKLTPEKHRRTRLVLRYRGHLQPRLAELPLYGFLDVAEFIMTRKMLLGIKHRAEDLAAS